jgi:tripartite-type tricarboxylate transporter receptor subunit TctC
MNKRTLVKTFAATLLAACMATQAFAIDNLTIIAPAKAGGGWDQTARAMAEVM